jgi:crotonobetainyl-CoA:carnitine CoA-transferase CaiB-like acyl-CoA transferase
VISLAHSATAALVNVAQNALVTGQEAGRWGNAHPNLVPYQLFRAADRPIVVAVGTDAQWVRCAMALELGDLINDPALATNAGRIAHRDRVVLAMETRIGQRLAAEWVARLGAVGVPTGLVRTVLEALSEVDCSPVTGVAPAPPGQIRYRPPRLDEQGSRVRAAGWEAFAASL